jgi:hypothetical protein
MWMRRKQYSLAQVLDDPAAGLAMKNSGMDRQSLALILDTVSRQRDGVEARHDAPFFG